MMTGPYMGIYELSMLCDAVLHFASISTLIKHVFTRYKVAITFRSEGYVHGHIITASTKNVDRTANNNKIFK